MIKQTFKIAAVLLFLAGLSSCTPIVKLITGVRNPQFYITTEERLEYYKPFYEEHKTKINIYTATDERALQTAFDSLWVPRIFVQNTKTDSVYVLSCYEDVEANIQDINDGKLGEVNPASRKEFAFFKNFITTQTILTYSENDTKENKEWNVYMINGIFMGNKMRRRSLPVTGINSLNEIVVFDISINEEVESSKTKH